MARGNFGERLKRERELREVTLQEITSATRIGPRFLEALENEDWEKLPGGVFNRGFVRSIARYLGLDEEALLGEYDLAHGTKVPAADEHPEQKIPSPPRWLPPVLVLGGILLLAALIVGGIYAWKYFAAGKSVRQPAPASSSASPEPPAEVVPAVSELAPPQTNLRAKIALEPMDLLVSTSEATHLLVLADGRVVFYDEVHSGENRHFTANENFEVTAANSSAVLLELNGRTMPPLGMPGTSGTIKLSHEDLRQATGGNSQP